MGEFIVSLPWYDIKEIQPATDAFWSYLSKNMRKEGLKNLPQHLNRAMPYERQWKSRKFLFGQACGYDVAITYSKQLQLIATPHYQTPGCKDNKYSSFVVVREDSPFLHMEDLRGKRCVINTITSHSGMNILKFLAAHFKRKERFFGSVKISGAHEKSLQMIVEQKADVAAIDCITYAILKRYRPDFLAATRTISQTQHVPAPPYVTSSISSKDTLERLQTALKATMDDPALSSVKAELLLDSIKFFPLEAYHPIIEMAQKTNSCRPCICF